MTATFTAQPPADAPRDAIESLVAELWRQVLGLERVGVNDHFYALGGDSLLATIVACGISDQTGIEIPPRITLEHPELGRQAEAVRRWVRSATGTEADSVQGAHPGYFRLSGQGTLPRSDRRGNVLAVVQMEPLTFHLLAAEQAVRALCERHRLQPDGEPADRYAGTDWPAPISRVLDLRLHPLIHRRRGRVFHDACREEALRSLYLDGRILRVSVALLPEETWTFLVISHRSVCDSASLGLLCHELHALYAASCGAGAAVLPGLPEDYAGYVQPHLLHLPGTATGKATCSKGPREVTALPIGENRDGERAASAGSCGASSSFLLDPGLTRALRRIAIEEESPLFVLVAAVYVALLAGWSGTSDVSIGCVSLNRSHSSVHGLVGSFAGITVLKCRAGDDPDFRTLLRRVRSEALGALSRTTADPLNGGAIGGGHSSLLPMLEYRGPGHPLASLDRIVDLGTAPYPLLLFAAESGDRLCLTLEYDVHQFRHEEMTELGGRLRVILENAGERPVTRVSRLGEGREGSVRALRIWREDLQSHGLKFLYRPDSDHDPEGLRRARAPSDAGPVTVLTAVHARTPRRLNRFLHSLRTQHYAGDVEIVVCDDASPCGEALMRTAETYGARYVRTGRASELPDAMHKCRALNAGLEAATGRYLLYLDSDILITPHHIQNCVNLAHHHGESVVCTNGRRDLINLLAWEHSEPIRRVHLTLDRALALLEHVATWEPVPSPNLGWPWLKVLGNNLFLSRALAERVGPWDEEYVGYGEEDIDYALRIERSGGVFARTAGLPVYHIGHPRQENDERQAALWGQNAIRFFTKFPEAIPLRPELYEKVRQHFGAQWRGADSTRK